MLDKDGYVSVLSRTDDVINVAGHRMSALALEEALLEHKDVIEAAVFGVPDELKVMFRKKKNNISPEEASTDCYISTK